MRRGIAAGWFKGNDRFNSFRRRGRHLISLFSFSDPSNSMPDVND
jgi:hypothetical protein